MLAISLLVSVAVGLVRGGSLRSLAEASMRGWPWYLTGFLVQAALSQPELVLLRNFVGYAFPLTFVLLIIGSVLDRKTRGMSVVTLGLVSNFVVIAINEGKMPVRASSQTVNADVIQAMTHSAITDATRLWLLSDIIRIPLLGHHYTLLSLGDILLAVGGFLVVQTLMLRGGGGTRDKGAE